MRYPSRSPSPIRGIAAKSLADLKKVTKTVGDAEEDDEHIYLEDDVEIENIAQTKTESQLKEE